MLTKSEAWEQIAISFENGHEAHCIYKNVFGCQGICTSITRLYGHDLISQLTTSEMRNQLVEYGLFLRKDEGCYFFPRTKEGAALRTELCRKFSKECC